MADDDSVLFVPAALAEHLFALAKTIRDTERRQAELMRGGVSFRSQVRFDSYLAQRQKSRTLTSGISCDAMAAPSRCEV